MEELLKAKNILADHINHRLINEKMDLEDENNLRLYEVLEILKGLIKEEEFNYFY